MGKKIGLILICLFWVALFGYMISQRLYAVTTISAMLLALALSLTNTEGK